VYSTRHTQSVGDSGLVSRSCSCISGLKHSVYTDVDCAVTYNDRRSVSGVAVMLRDPASV